MRRLTKSSSKILTVILSLFLAAIVFAKSEMPVTVVGEVTMVIGKSTVTGIGGQSVVVRVGLPIHVGDAIETDSNGHVHIRFVDEELVSVRPLSTLEIVRYEYNPQNPQSSVVKLNLVEGVTRAISGQAAKQARQNFRLDTPIAAIGVRGTDFAVSATGQSLHAIVNEGAIVVAPYSSQCSAAALGPCSQNAVELSGLSRQILELNAGDSGISSTLLPATSAQAQALMAEASATRTDAGTKAGKASGDTKDIYNDTVTSRAVNTTLASSESVKAEPPPVVIPTPPVLLPEFTPDVAQTAEALTANTQLVWGRWSGANLDKERITVSYDVAIENNRQVTVGNVDYALFRTETAGKSVQPGLGVLAFNLNKAQAMFNAGGQGSLMQVSGGQLSLDFNQQTFSTSLQLSHAATGDITFEDSGHIFAGGYFNSNHDTQSMAGAVSLDGKEAGYLFDKTLVNGSVSGLTLWTQKP